VWPQNNDRKRFKSPAAGDLKLALNKDFSNSAHIRYKMFKLIYRGVIQKQGL
jgi:hypothetical protein